MNSDIIKWLELADAEVHRQVYSLIAEAQQGEIINKEGLLYTVSADGPEPTGNVLFPSLSDEQAGAMLDEMMDYYRAHNARGVGCWSLHPPRPADLGIRLLARGFQPGWTPCWMGRDLLTVEQHYSLPADIVIRADNTTSTHAEKELPYHGDNGVVSHALMQSHPHRLQRFLAFQGDKVVGQSCVFLATGTDKIAGLFNVGVLPPFRRQHIGKALVLAGCQWAKEQGYHYMLLNATGRRMYMQAGFKYVGDGQTWWLMSDRYITHPPTKEDVLLAEAVGRGDTGALDRLLPHLTVDALGKPMANGMSLFELAIHYRQPAAIKWLDQQGAPCTPLDAWQLGWKERAASILANNPQEVNRTYGHMKQTLLHTAVEKNDAELARLALSFKPDLSLRDCVYQATALDWAQHFNNVPLIELISKNGYI